MTYTKHYMSPVGVILLAADDAGLTGLWFEGSKYFAAELPKAHIEHRHYLCGATKPPWATATLSQDI